MSKSMGIIPSPEMQKFIREIVRRQSQKVIELIKERNLIPPFISHVRVKVSRILCCGGQPQGQSSYRLVHASRWAAAANFVKSLTGGRLKCPPGENCSPPKWPETPQPIDAAATDFPSRFRRLNHQRRKRGNVG